MARSDALNLKHQIDELVKAINTIDNKVNELARAFSQNIPDNPEPKLDRFLIREDLIKGLKPDELITPMSNLADSAEFTDGSRIDKLLSIAGTAASLQNAQDIAAQRLKDYDGEIYPSDGCAITLSVLLQKSGIEVEDTFMAIDMCRVLKDRGWERISIGDQRRGTLEQLAAQRRNTEWIMFMWSSAL